MKHFNKKEYILKKQSITNLPIELKEILIGCGLGDAYIKKMKNGTYIKFDQGSKHKEYMEHLWNLFNSYCYKTELSIRKDKTGQIKSYYFRTWSLPIFDFLNDLYQYKDHKKTISSGLILNNLTARGLAYWIMDDGSLDGNTMILHTQGYTKEECELLSKELNEKFNLNSKIKTHKSIYNVIQIPYTDSSKLKELISPYIIPYFKYKIPKS